MKFDTKYMVSLAMSHPGVVMKNTKFGGRVVFLPGKGLCWAVDKKKVNKRAIILTDSKECDWEMTGEVVKI